MSEHTQTQEATTEVEKNSQAASAETPKQNLLFGTLSYKDDTSYENFIQSMSVGQALVVMIASANFAQAKGSFNILESEVLANAIRVIRKNSTPAKEQTEPSNS